MPIIVNLNPIGLQAQVAQNVGALATDQAAQHQAAQAQAADLQRFQVENNATLAERRMALDERTQQERIDQGYYKIDAQQEAQAQRQQDAETLLNLRSAAASGRLTDRGHQKLQELESKQTFQAGENQLRETGRNDRFYTNQDRLTTEADNNRTFEEQENTRRMEHSDGVTMAVQAFKSTLADRNADARTSDAIQVQAIRALQRHMVEIQNNIRQFGDRDGWRGQLYAEAQRNLAAMNAARGGGRPTSPAMSLPPVQQAMPNVAPPTNLAPEVSGGPPVPIESDADYMALPPGTQYVAPDGTVRVKK